jgi:hypothetical protein
MHYLATLNVFKKKKNPFQLNSFPIVLRQLSGSNNCQIESNLFETLVLQMYLSDLTHTIITSI